MSSCCDRALDTPLATARGDFMAATRARACTNHPALTRKGTNCPFATTALATAGIVEYTGNTFCAHLRVNLLLSQLEMSKSAGLLYRARIYPPLAR